MPTEFMISFRVEKEGGREAEAGECLCLPRGSGWLYPAWVSDSGGGDGYGRGRRRKWFHQPPAYVQLHQLGVCHFRNVNTLFLLSISFSEHLAIYIIFRTGACSLPHTQPISVQSCYTKTEKSLSSLWQQPPVHSTVSSGKAHSDFSWYPLLNPNLWKYLKAAHSSWRKEWIAHTPELTRALCWTVGKEASQGRYHLGHGVLLDGLKKK